MILYLTRKQNKAIKGDNLTYLSATRFTLVVGSLALFTTEGNPVGGT